ncbi:MAG: NAD-dependent epimerase/dehydratase family protein [Thermoanaerobaculia bacterium]
MRIAVTGGSGFIGRHVLRELERQGIEPVVVLRPETTVTEEARRHEVVRMDIGATPANAFELLGEPDALLHLAWGGLPNYGSRHHVDAELPAHYKFLEALVAGGLGTVVATGTCLEYGMEEGALNENLQARPMVPYATAKDSLRSSLQNLQRQRPFNLTWTRLFYLFGEGQAAGSLLPQLRDAVARGEKSFNMSGGEQLRDYLPVKEAARILVRLTVDAGDNGVVNICSGVPISVRRLVEGWIRENGWQITPNPGYYPYQKHEPMEFWGDRTKLDRCLGSHTQISRE